MTQNRSLRGNNNELNLRKIYVLEITWYIIMLWICTIVRSKLHHENSLNVFPDIFLLKTLHFMN